MYNSIAQTFPKLSSDEVANVFIRNAILQIVSSFYQLVNKYGNLTNNPILAFWIILPIRSRQNGFYIEHDTKYYIA